MLRYTVTYEPAADRILPSPKHLFVRVKNTAAIPLRAAYLHGPYTLHASVYPADFNPNEKVKDVKSYGEPQFEPNLKAGGSWNAKIPVPEEIRVSGSSGNAPQQQGEGQSEKLTWIVEVTSQIIFSSSASVSFELLVSRDERSLDYSFAAISGQPTQGLRSVGSAAGQIEDHQQTNDRHHGMRPSHTKGIYSKAIHLVVDNTESLWNTPPFPKYEEEKDRGKKAVDEADRKSSDHAAEPPRKKQKIHLVILTHGLHSNLSADMLYLKESIDQSAQEARENKKRRKAEANTPKATDIVNQVGVEADGSKDKTREHIEEDPEEDGDELIMVRGFTGNAVKTENGIQYLGKRMAKYILDLTYPDQPYKPIRKSMSEKLGIGMTAKKAQTTDDNGNPTHNGSTIRKEDVSNANLAYTFSKISFIGHSLGGLIQLYAIGYIQKHAPHFFDHIEPVNFVALATPFLGLSNENPMYVKFALDFGLVGRTGQDLGLTWKPPSLAKQGWNAMGFGKASEDPEHPDPGAKPLLRILPTGPAHRVLRMFRNRTVYSNVVNDGIVPLRTSCLLFLDWKGLNRVEKARRNNGILGTAVNWGWSELTGASSSSPGLIGTTNPAAILSDDDVSRADSDDVGSNRLQKMESTVPQPAEDETNQDYQEQGGRGSAEHHYLQDRATSPSPAPARALDGIRNFLGLTLKTSKKDMKIYKRTQTNSLEDASQNAQEQARTNPQQNRGRPAATRGDSVLEDPNSNAPPKTSIFESAGDILNPPIPPSSWINDPSSRVRTIFHDRVYHPEDIPPPTLKRTKTSERRNGAVTGAASHIGTSEAGASDPGNMKVEEKIARAYHKDLSWRKVLVRLEPDAHNNMIVRRMFANAYGWPVVKHLCDTHFADTYAARTRDEDEPATDRAKGVERPIGERGEHVQGQEDSDMPKARESEMREQADELRPLRDSEGTGDSTPKTGPSTCASASITSPSKTSSSYDSYDERYYLDNTDDEMERPGLAQRFWSPPPIFGGGGGPSSSSPPSQQTASSPRSRKGDDNEEEGHYYGTSQAEIADFLTSEPPIMEGHRGLEPVPTSPRSVRSRGAGDVGLRKSLDGQRPGSRDGVGVSESVARTIGSPKSSKPGGLRDEASAA